MTEGATIAMAHKLRESQVLVKQDNENAHHSAEPTSLVPRLNNAKMIGVNECVTLILFNAEA